MLWQFNRYIIPFLIGALPLSYATVLSWRRRDHLPEKICFWLMLAILWTITIYAIELSITDPTLMLYLRRLQYTGGLALSTLMLLFILAQTGREQFITRRNVILLFVEPVLYYLLVWTNEYHHLHWQKVEAVNVGGLVLLAHTYSSNLVFWFGVIYLYATIITSFYLILSKLLTAPAPFRNQYLLLLLALAFPWIMNFIDVTGLNPVKHLEIVLYGMMFSSIPLAWGLFRHQLLDLTPAAHDMVIRSIGNAVFVLDRANRVVDVNPAGTQLLGIEHAQLIGQSAQQLFASKEIDLARFDKVLDAQEQVNWDRQEALGHYNLRISPLYNHWGQITGRVITMYDLIYQKQAEQQTLALALEQEKVKLLQQFIDASSHDLSTPITTLLMSIKLLKNSIAQAPEQLLKLNSTVSGTDETLQKALAQLDKITQSTIVNSDRIDISVQRLQKLVAGMLELAQLDKNLALTTSKNDLNQLVNDVVNEVKSVAETQGISIHCEVDEGIGSIIFDLRELRRSIKHLVDNALHFTLRDGTIWVKTYQQQQQAVVEITDTGIGISSEEMPFIFDRFYRADKARSAQTGGMGVGLAIVKKIVDSHQGTVDVSSTPGTGTTVLVRLPLQ